MEYCVSYRRDGKRYGEVISADNWRNAEKICEQSNFTLDGELIHTVSAAEQRYIANMICYIRKAFRENKINRAVKKLLA